MKTEKLTPVEWLLNELDERDMIDKTIYHEKDRTFDSISEQALSMEKEYSSQSKWISVEEILPEDGEQVLVIRKKPNVGYYIPANALFSFGEFKDVDGDNEGFKPEIITHWQPLPPPPSEKK